MAAEFYMKRRRGIQLKNGPKRFISKCFFLELEIYLEVSMGVSYLGFYRGKKLECAFLKTHLLVPLWLMFEPSTARQEGIRHVKLWGKRFVAEASLSGL